MPIPNEDPQDWKYSSPDGPGFHQIVSPDNSPCKVTWCYRLNLPRGTRHLLRHELLEISAVVVHGSVDITTGGRSWTLGKFDSLYTPSRNAVEFVATHDAIVYLGGAPDDGSGVFFVRTFDATLPLGDIRQVHGKPPYRRDVFMTLNQEVPASRLITGLTWGDAGGWTSWPPHQHEQDLEEVYCYFDIPAPSFALHLAYLNPGGLEAVHPVRSGDFVAIPRGYHPTIAMPGVRSSYFWVMAAHSHRQRSYERSVPDPAFVR